MSIVNEILQSKVKESVWEGRFMSAQQELRTLRAKVDEMERGLLDARYLYGEHVRQLERIKRFLE